MPLLVGIRGSIVLALAAFLARLAHLAHLAWGHPILKVSGLCVCDGIPLA